MDGEKLVSMANQIAAYFRAYPEDDAVTGVRDHITAFWTPRMCRTLHARIEDNPAGIEHLVIAAMTRPHQGGESPIKKEVQGPGKLGQLGSDAG